MHFYWFIPRKLRLWFTDENYKKASVLDKWSNYFMTFLLVVCVVNAVIYQLIKFSKNPLETTVLKILHLIVIGMAFNLQYLGSKYRKEYSDLIRFVNSLSLSVLKRHPKLRPLRNKVYLLTLGVAILILFGILVAPLSYVIYTIKTGQLFFGFLWPFKLHLHSASVYILCAVQIGLIYWIAIKTFFFLTIVLEPVLILAIAYKMIALELCSLRTGEDFNEDLEFVRLKSLMEECSVLQRCVILNFG